MNLIDADDLKDWSEIVPLTEDGGIDINDFEEKLRSMPTVDAVPVVHGHWLVNMFFIECSECGESFPIEPQNYCPNCGARMDEVNK